MSQLLPIPCPYFASHVKAAQNVSPDLSHVVRKGYYFRSSDRKWILRFKCMHCKRSYSRATSDPCFMQKKRQLNPSIEELYYSGVSLRRIARLLKINPKTVVRTFLFLGLQAIAWRRKFLEQRYRDRKITHFTFDEMESFEKSKCLPVSIPLIVETGTRKILAFDVCSMPAKGLLAQISRKKYGKRADHRPKAVSRLLNKLSTYVSPTAELKSDENPKYPKWIKPHFPKATHLTFKGKRGCIVGQGELKKTGFDPLFDLNHTAAMLRANINRLFRRTWCTTKRMDRLMLHIAIYAKYHNEVLTA